MEQRLKTKEEKLGVDNQKKRKRKRKRKKKKENKKGKEINSNISFFSMPVLNSLNI